MRKLHLLSTVAATLLLSAGMAWAQDTNGQSPARAPAAQQSAPAEKIAPPMHGGERKGPETTGQASPETKLGGHNKAEMKSGKSETTGQAPKASGKAEMNEKDRSGASSKEMRNSTESKGGVNAQENGRSGTSQRSSESVNSKSSTVGQGAAAGNAKLSTEQSTKITTIIRKQKVRPTQLNISVHVGARVPGSVHFYPLPTEVIEVYPEWRGYDYILVGDEIIVVNPRSHLVVAVLDA